MITNLRRNLPAVIAVLAITATGCGSATHQKARPAPRPSASVSVATTPAPVSDIGQPSQLVIPDIAVNAPTDPVGTTSEGAQIVPSAIDRTGWWRDGASPGQPGNAVIVGHTARSADGVFDRLGQLTKGEAITVRGKHGSVAYQVSRVTSIKVTDFDKYAARIYRSSGPSGLVLMTCGDWNGAKYESTTVVFAKTRS